ncbi:unnamed protein product [Wuchereria bancrofti]|uniref:Uncharacterized protein n=1 Tax=Wuchereria bancrofti TaxID=6293 RepID=A0A3P7E2T2_WUCBA|nr:unnamed protein product [Wuchereria bancrofti]
MGDTMLVKKRPVSINEMNLKSIQRLDPCAVAIIDKVINSVFFSRCLHFNRHSFESSWKSPVHVTVRNLFLR